MRLTRLCIVRSTPLGPDRARRRLLAFAGCLAASSFAGGFAASRYGIDRELADSTALLDRSARAYEAEQTLLFGQWAENYARLHQRIAALPERKEVLHHGR